MDRGANGGILGNDAKVIGTYEWKVDVTGIDNHEINDLKMVDAAAVVKTQKGMVVAIFKQYAYHGLNRTIHSSGQIEHFKNKVHDRSITVGGRQCIVTLEGYVIPIDIINGLPYIKMTPPTDEQMETLPHVILTSGAKWDPRVLDHLLTDKEQWYNEIRSESDDVPPGPFDERGNYRKREPHHPPIILPATPTNDEELTASYHESFLECYKTLVNLNQPCILSESTYEAFDTETEASTQHKEESHVQAPTTDTSPQKVNYSKYAPFFLHVPVEKIQRTFERTTQFATNIVAGNHIRQTIKSPNPAFNVPRRNEPVATDTVFADTPAICTGGQNMAQIFVGRKSLVIDVYGMGNEKEFVNTLEDVIRHRGAPDVLISDSAQVETSERVLDVLRALCIDDWQSEPNYQHQNFAEHRYKHLQRNFQWYMNWRNVDPEAWLLCLQWVGDVMNHTAEKSLGWRPPLEVLTGQTVDISILLYFAFWDVVYVPRYKSHKYSGQLGSESSSEIRGRFVGFAWSVGHHLTFKILTDDTKKIICRSRVRLAKEGVNNLKLDVESGAIPERIYVKSKRDGDKDLRLPTIDMNREPFDIPDSPEDGEEEEPMDEVIPEKGELPATTVQEGEREFSTKTSPMDHPTMSDLPTVETVDDEEDLAPHLRDQRKPGDPNPEKKPLDFSLEHLDTPNPTTPGLPPEDMIDRTFLMPPADDGSRVRAKIIQIVEDHKTQGQSSPEFVRFKCLVDDKYEEVVAYNEIVDYIEQDESWDGTWKFREILRHEGPLTRKSPKYKGSSYNVLILWETGEQTWEPLHTADRQGIYEADRVSVALYAAKHGLLDTPGWKLPGLRKLAKTQKRMIRTANQAKLHSFRTKPMYMYGFQVPRNHEQAMELDRINGNSRWRDAELAELSQINEYETFVDKGIGYVPGPGYKKIRVHMVYAVKHDGRHKARLVAGGHLTDTPIDSVYSSVVSLRGIRLLTFIAELNGCDTWATDIGNAYLESYTQEKVFIIAGPEFGELEGHVLIISKALYGLKSSGLRWHERFADVLREMGFFPSRAEPDIWMRDMGDHYEYIGVYVDDLLIVSKNCKDIIEALEKKHCFKLKGSGPITFHLGCDFFRDSDGVLCYAPRKYIEKVLANYQRLFGKMPRQVMSPLIKGDHPELDTSELLDLDNQKIYQSLIGSLQWAIQIGRFDIGTSVMTLSRFRAVPRHGHLERVKRICGYLSKMRHGVIRIRTEEPDYSAIPEKVYDWEYTCYRGAKEILPTDAPTPRGKRVLLTTYVDANLYHDMISGRSVTGVLHLANKTPIDWFSKLQATVETATFGSEFVAARSATEQTTDIRNTFRYLGVPVETPTMMFGDNETVVNSSSVPHSKLMKRHNALSYHRVREAIAARIMAFHHIPGADNPADILSKHWEYSAVWKQLQALLFWQGDTANTLKKD